MYSLRDHIQKPALSEATSSLHLEHIEDEILNGGIADAHVALNTLHNITRSLAGYSDAKVDVTTKWDGSPAIVCGTNPENGRFFVGTKSVFNKRSPKIIYSRDDINRYYKNNPGLSRQLEVALTYLPELGIRGVLQGDIMFGRDEVRLEKINSEDCVTFRPNTIVYAIPAHLPLAERIRRAKLGVIFHTTYSGNTLRDMKPSFKVDLRNLNTPEDVWYDDASYKDETGSATLTTDELNAINDHIKRAEDVLNDVDVIRFEQLTTNKTLVGMLKMFANQQIRIGQQFQGDYIEGFKRFVEERINNEKTQQKAKENKTEKYTQLIDKLQPTIEKVLQFQQSAVNAKMLLINKLHKIESVGTFIPRGDGGYEETKHEGFVAVDHLTNKAVKLVDRLEFSRNNFRKQR